MRRWSTFFSVMKESTTRAASAGAAQHVFAENAQEQLAPAGARGVGGAGCEMSLRAGAHGRLGSGGAGTLSLRQREAGPNTPWCRTKCWRGGGTRVARRRKSQPGVAREKQARPARSVEDPLAFWRVGQDAIDEVLCIRRGQL